MGVIRVIDLKRGDRRESVYDECESTIGCMIMYKRSMPVMRTGTSFVFYFNTHAASSILMFCTVISPSKLSATARTKEEPRKHSRGKVNPTPMLFMRRAIS
jgi:hypothetical protein